MSHNESMQSADEVGTQTSVSLVSSLIDTGTATSDESLQSMNRSEANSLPEGFLSNLLAKAVAKPSETDNSFVREQPW